MMGIDPRPTARGEDNQNHTTVHGEPSEELLLRVCWRGYESWMNILMKAALSRLLFVYAKTLDCRQFSGAFVKTEEMVTAKNARRDDVKNIVGSKTMFRSMALYCFLKHRFECSNVRPRRTEENSRPHIVLKRRPRDRCLLLRYPRVSTLLAEPYG